MKLLRAVYASAATILALVLVAPVLVLGLPFWVVAFLTRTLARRLEPPFGTWRDLVRFDRTIGWRPRPNVDGYFLSEQGDVFHVVTDGEGWPGRHGFVEGDVIVFGDSIAFGWGIDAARSYKELSPRLRIKTVSAPGYNLVQELLLMHEIAPRLTGKLVVWFIYHGNDLYDNLSPFMGSYRTPFVRNAKDGLGWEIVTSHLRPRAWRIGPGRHDWRRGLASLYGPTFLAQRAYSACDFLLGEAKKICDGAGAHLVVCTIPSPSALGERASRLKRYSEQPESFDPGFPDQQIGELCRARGISFIAGTRHITLSDYNRPDDHWTERGHRRMAEVLQRIYDEHARGARGAGPMADQSLPAGIGTAGSGV
ncbi:MAG TPA: SGNH/GDSL hydrolase family protein [bacterium]